jgi:hypothetical protein
MEVTEDLNNIYTIKKEITRLDFFKLLIYNLLS